MQSPGISPPGLPQTATPISCDFPTWQRKETCIFYVILDATSVGSQLHIYHRENAFPKCASYISDKSYSDFFFMLETKPVTQISGIDEY